MKKSGKYLSVIIAHLIVLSVFYWATFALLVIFLDADLAMICSGLIMVLRLAIRSFWTDVVEAVNKMKRESN